MRRRPLRGVLLGAIGGVAVGAVLLTGVLTIGIVNLTAERTAFAELRRDAEVAARRMQRAGVRQTALPACRSLPTLGVGQVCVVFPGRAPSEIAGLGAPEGRALIDGEELLYTSHPITTGGVSGRVYVFRPAASGTRPGRALVGRFGIAALVAVGVSAAVAYVLAKRIARPLSDLAGAARTLASGRPGRPLPPAANEPAEVAELRDALAEVSSDLAEARKRERAFLMSVSHELRTPLTAIRGYGEALVDGTARGTQRAGDVIVGESRRLERLVADLLDLARLQAGEFSVTEQETDLADVALAVVESMRPRAKDAGVRLEARQPKDATPHLVATDPDRAHQLIANLVENALRVTPSDGRVVVKVDGSTVTVEDSGPGLDPADITHAFERFYLWRKYRGERAVGTGLGLAIVGELARLLGAKVDVASSPDGTRFAITFPAAV